MIKLHSSAAALRASFLGSPHSNCLAMEKARPLAGAGKAGHAQCWQNPRDPAPWETKRNCPR